MDDTTTAALLRELEAALLREGAMDPMKLTEAEKDYVQRVKTAAIAQGEDKLTDFQLAHHALADDQLEVAVSKIAGLQQFRAHYDINDTVEQGVQYLDAFMSQQQAFVLHLDVTEGSWESIRVLDVAKLNPQAAMAMDQSGRGVDHHWKQFVCGLYYMHTACSPYLASIRQGVFEIADLDSLGSHNFSMEFEHRRHGELIGCFPLKFKTIMAYNTGYLANVSWNLMKPFMNENTKKSIQLGCQVLEPDGSSSNRRLAEFYLQPNIEIAQRSVIARAKTLLEIRYLNEQLFKI